MSRSVGAHCSDMTIDSGEASWAVRSIVPVEAAPGAAPVVFLHEGLGCIELWRRFPEQVASRIGRKVVLFDRLGHGRSGGLREKRRIDYLHRCASEELAPLLEALEIEKPTLVGHSDGGTIALLHAASSPCAAVITVAAHASVEEEALVGIRRTVDRWSTTRLRQSLERYHGDKAEDLFRAWSETWLGESFREWSIFEELAGVRCRTLVLQGEEDEYASRRHPHDIAAAVGGLVEVGILPECGHSPHLQRPELLLETIVSWLDEGGDQG